MKQLQRFLISMMSATIVVAGLSSFFLSGCGASEASCVGDDPDPGKAVDPLPSSSLVCEPGERYVCDCPAGNRGNKFCSWDGKSFGDCILCGMGAEYIEDTGIPCDTNPPSGQPEVPCPVLGGCTELVCFSKTCHLATSLPATVLTDVSVNDCQQSMCDGNGNAVIVPDPLDCDGSCDDTGACVAP